VVARAIACCLLLVLTSCQIPKYRLADSGPVVPTAYNVPTGADAGELPGKLPGPLPGAAAPRSEAPPPDTSGINSAQLSIEEFYNDPLITQLVYQALAGNRELKILEEDIQIARADVLRRQGAYFPFVFFKSDAGFERPSDFTPEGAAEKLLPYLPGKNFPSPLGNFMYGLNLMWHPDIWRELRNARDAAAQRYLSAIEKRNAFVTRMVADIAENYFTLMALDQRIAVLNQTIDLQTQSLDVAIARMEAGRGNVLAVQRFQGEVRRLQSEKLIVRQEIVEAENRINFLANRYPQNVERSTAAYLDLTIRSLNVGVPAQLLLNRPDIRQAERELVAAGLDVKAARAHFFPSVDLSAGIGYRAFNLKYLFFPDALIAGAAGDLTAPLINKKAIQADYITANAKQLEALYTYQRTILNAYTEVLNRLNAVENYRKSVEIKRRQLEALQAAVQSARDLFQSNRAEYLEVLLALRDFVEARTVVIDTKRQQLTAIVNAYQAIGGGNTLSIPAKLPAKAHLWPANALWPGLPGGPPPSVGGVPPGAPVPAAGPVPPAAGPMMLPPGVP
jgi:NodT family efflux transporter outer membrane factor (OMF) lipoprotein